MDVTVIGWTAAYTVEELMRPKWISFGILQVVAAGRRWRRG